MLNCIAGGIEMRSTTPRDGHALIFGLGEGDLEKNLAWEELLIF